MKRPLRHGQLKRVGCRCGKAALLCAMSGVEAGYDPRIVTAHVLCQTASRARYLLLYRC